MRAHLELTAAERKTLGVLTGEERHAVIDQMLETVREELEWVVALDRARTAAAEATGLVARVEATTGAPVAARASASPSPKSEGSCWPTTLAKR